MCYIHTLVIRALPSHTIQQPEALKHAPSVMGGQDVYVWVYLNYQHLTDQDLNKLVANTSK